MGYSEPLDCLFSIETGAQGSGQQFSWEKCQFVVYPSFLKTIRRVTKNDGGISPIQMEKPGGLQVTTGFLPVSEFEGQNNFQLKNLNNDESPKFQTLTVNFSSKPPKLMAVDRFSGALVVMAGDHLFYFLPNASSGTLHLMAEITVPYHLLRVPAANEQPVSHLTIGVHSVRGVQLPESHVFYHLSVLGTVVAVSGPGGVTVLDMLPTITRQHITPAVVPSSSQVFPMLTPITASVQVFYPVAAAAPVVLADLAHDAIFANGDYVSSLELFPIEDGLFSARALSACSQQELFTPSTNRSLRSSGTDVQQVGLAVLVGGMLYMFYRLGTPVADHTFFDTGNVDSTVAVKASVSGPFIIIQFREAVRVFVASYSSTLPPFEIHAQKAQKTIISVPWVSQNPDYSVVPSNNYTVDTQGPALVPDIVLSRANFVADPVASHKTVRLASKAGSSVGLWYGTLEMLTTKRTVLELSDVFADNYDRRFTTFNLGIHSGYRRYMMTAQAAQEIVKSFEGCSFISPQSAYVLFYAFAVDILGVDGHVLVRHMPLPSAEKTSSLTPLFRSALGLLSPESYSSVLVPEPVTPLMIQLASLLLRHSLGVLPSQSQGTPGYHVAVPDKVHVGAAALLAQAHPLDFEAVLAELCQSQSGATLQEKIRAIPQSVFNDTVRQLGDKAKLAPLCLFINSALTERSSFDSFTPRTYAYALRVAPLGLAMSSLRHAFVSAPTLAAAATVIIASTSGYSEKHMSDGDTRICCVKWGVAAARFVLSFGSTLDSHDEWKLDSLVRSVTSTEPLLHPWPGIKRLDGEALFDECIEILRPGLLAFGRYVSASSALYGKSEAMSPLTMEQLALLGELVDRSIDIPSCSVFRAFFDPRLIVLSPLARAVYETLDTTDQYSLGVLIPPICAAEFLCCCDFTHSPAMFVGVADLLEKLVPTLRDAGICNGVKPSVERSVRRIAALLADIVLMRASLFRARPQDMQAIKESATKLADIIQAESLLDSFSNCLDNVRTRLWLVLVGHYQSLWSVVVDRVPEMVFYYAQIMKSAQPCSTLAVGAGIGPEQQLLVKQINATEDVLRRLASNQ